MAAVTLAPIDIEIRAQQIVLRKLQTQMRACVATFSQMAPKERAKNLLEIQKTIESLNRFFDKLPGLNIQNTGTRFAAENLKQSFFSLVAQWKKFEASLNSSRAN